MCFSSRSSLYVLLAWMIDWNGRESFFTATFSPVFISTAELVERGQWIRLHKWNDIICRKSLLCRLEYTDPSHLTNQNASSPTNRHLSHSHLKTGPITLVLCSLSVSRRSNGATRTNLWFELNLHSRSMSLKRNANTCIYNIKMLSWNHDSIRSAT